jgi:hypothetical protein
MAGPYSLQELSGTNENINTSEDTEAQTSRPRTIVSNDLNNSCI